MPALRDRLTVVILTCNRADELRTTLRHMRALPERPRLLVVDNGSRDHTRNLVRAEFPDVELLVCPNNIGAAARNLGVEATDTPYIAFCDDDSWWASGSLEQAADLLDTNPRVAGLCARILLGPEQREDPVCELMAHSPMPANGLPGPSLLGFIACAAVFRRDAFLAAGGYERRFFVGGEEALLTLDLVASGWRIVYAPHLTVHHHPSPRRDRKDRHRILARNAIWVAWLRLPLAEAWAETRRMLAYARGHGVLGSTLASALRELPWVLRKRRVISHEISYWYRLLQG